MTEIQTHSGIAARLAKVCERCLGETAEVSGLKRLTGGASMESWAFDYGAHQLVMRRLPLAMAEAETPDTLAGMTIEQEAEIIRAAGKAGVTAPAIVGILDPAEGLSRGFLMTRIKGEAFAKVLQSDPAYQPARDRFIADCAREIARIHKTPVRGAVADLPLLDAQASLTSLKERYRMYGARSVMFEAAFAWLSEHRPEPGGEICLVHGDFRLGNLLLSETELTGVLDWETAHRGDPVQDLAYICVPAWRFAIYDKPVAGIGEIEDLLRAYEVESGRQIDRRRFQYWLVYSTLWWGVACLTMANVWRTGLDRTLERAVIGRRVSEVELDLLLLLEGDAPPVEARVDWAVPEDPVVSGETVPFELTQALAEWVKADVQPNVSGRDKFQALVARNALGMLQRHTAFGERFRCAAADRLASLSMTEVGLFEAASEGALDFKDPNLLQHLRYCVLETLYLDQPKYPGLAYAQKVWGISP
ncbi:MAG: phosphotransferase family protein [Henriciella sp.]|nr:phosphotransferase family protein [Henriciella sp.]